MGSRGMVNVGFSTVIKRVNTVPSGILSTVSSMLLPYIYIIFFSMVAVSPSSCIVRFSFPPAAD